MVNGPGDQWCGRVGEWEGEWKWKIEARKWIWRFRKTGSVVQMRGDGFE